MLEKIIALIEKDGVGAIIIAMAIYFLWKVGNRLSNKQQCIYTSEFKEVHDLMVEIKTLFRMFVYSKYRGKDDE